MTGYHSCVFLALLLIYPHSTNQTVFWHDRDVLMAEMQEEKARCKLTVLESISKAITAGKPVHVACDELTADEKRQLCDEAMRFAVAEEIYMDPNARRRRVDEFINGAISDLEVPRLANPSDPYTCKKIFIDALGCEKRMFWCMNRVFALAGSGAPDQAEGFFVSGSRTTFDTVYLYKPPQPDSRKVSPWAMMTSVGIIRNAAERCGMHRVVGLTVATVTPLPQENLDN